MDKTPESFMRAIRDLAAEDTDYVDPLAAAGSVCRYKESARDGYPGCLVGQAAIRAGFSASEISEAVSVAGFLGHLFGDALTAQEIDWVRNVQLNQDAAVCWGEAVRLADLGDVRVRQSWSSL